MIIIPTDTMAMMTPHKMYQTLFGSSAINQSEGKENENHADNELGVRMNL